MLKRLIHFWDRTSLHLSRWVYYAAFAAAALFMLSYFIDTLFNIGVALLLLTLLSTCADAVLLYLRRYGVKATRQVADRWSNGDENPVTIRLKNRYSFPLHCRVIDEMPFQFQQRDWHREVDLPAGGTVDIAYSLRPVQRGVYGFGGINVYADGPLRLVRRRFFFDTDKQVRVYPSFLQMRRHQLHAVAAPTGQAGQKRLRKLGHSMEFEQIKNYVRGDDYRTINWKATARHGDLMTNNYTDERSQQVYCIINKGRVMKMPFQGLSLLDYAINASLVLSSVALQKQDKAGLICFGDEMGTFLPADKKPTQINHILEGLYKQETEFLESDFEKLFSLVRNRITHRSLLVLFTNFESVESLNRELASLKKLAHYHLLVVVFFENTELRVLTESNAGTIEDIYIKTIAGKYQHEKILIAKELRKHGIISVLSTPQNLTINSLNKYLELKNRHSI